MLPRHAAPTDAIRRDFRESVAPSKTIRFRKQAARATQMSTDSLQSALTMLPASSLLVLPVRSIGICVHHVCRSPVVLEYRAALDKSQCFRLRTAPEYEAFWKGGTVSKQLHVFAERTWHGLASRWMAIPYGTWARR